MEKLKKEIEKCDIVCANCHLKYHYNHDRRQSRIIVEAISNQFEEADEKLILTQDEKLTLAIVNNYFPEGIDPAYLTGEFYDGLSNIEDN